MGEDTDWIIAWERLAEDEQKLTIRYNGVPAIDDVHIFLDCGEGTVRGDVYTAGTVSNGFERTFQSQVKPSGAWTYVTLGLRGPPHILAAFKSPFV